MQYWHAASLRRGRTQPPDTKPFAPGLLSGDCAMVLPGPGKDDAGTGQEDPGENVGNTSGDPKLLLAYPKKPG